MIPYIDLFCGCGGASVGLARAGWHCVGAVDVSERALEIYKANFPRHTTHQLDLSVPLPFDLVTQWRARLREGVVWASSPCTGFSLATRQPRCGTRSLTLAVADHVATLRPRVLLFENVPRARKCDEFVALVDALRSTGYAVAHQIVDIFASLGLAQTRKRLVLVAFRIDDVDTRETAEAELQVRLCKAFVPSRAGGTMRACFMKAGVAVSRDFVYFQTPDEKNKRSIYSLDEPAPTIRGCIRPFRATYAFTARDASHKAACIFAAECPHMAALQGFPSEYTWIGSKTAIAKSIGNAVPPPLASALAELVSTSLLLGAQC